MSLKGHTFSGIFYSGCLRYGTRGAGVHRFSICVLLYGGDEFGWLHRRCLESLLCTLPGQAAEVRIGLNAVTSAAWTELLPRLTAHFDSVQVFAGENVGKYPRMREMLQTATREYVVWYDDDTFNRAELIGCAQAWLDEIAGLLTKRPGVLGALYRKRWTPGRREWLQQQPGYRGRPVDPKYERFITGGWWVSQLAILRALDWPRAELYHNGGDRLLGSLMLQNNYELVPFRRGVAINADQDGNESKAPRRGISMRGLGD